MNLALLVPVLLALAWLLGGMLLIDASLRRAHRQLVSASLLCGSIKADLIAIKATLDNTTIPSPGGQ